MSLSNSNPAAAAESAKAASHFLATLNEEGRNAALQEIHDELKASKDEILAANAEDMEKARKAASDGSLSSSLVSRLDLSKPGKYDEMLKGILDVKNLKDPIGKIDLRTKLDDGLILERISCPIGVLLVIFEARPEVIANIASLAVKSGNAAILKGGNESEKSFVAISKVISNALERTHVPNGAIQLVLTRDAIAQLLDQDQYIDLVIPRGSNSLVRYIKSSTRIPVLGHADGLCAIYVEGSADPEMASSVVVDAKTSYPAACNATETLLVQDAALSSVWPSIASALLAKGVELRCDAATKEAIKDVKVPKGGSVKDSTEEDYKTEFLAHIIAVKKVSGVDEATEHINNHSSHHTESILTADKTVAEKFMSACDSAGVYWNTTTRMADGMRYGFGTEVGISTNKIHARGPVGLEGLMIYKYKIRGTGQISVSYGEGPGKKHFKHEPMPISDSR
ncbi:hypothetical protein MKZ38_005572 [Zalerion maritima]|uniref:glutamate-5-semialdehyde dehydrogenase n=1 Tax=Zalerion maritima TaxID=339359 RepID=A0AAD5RJY1_9PEZI|nr:hypothetical protein MKZ38_005572 [Zalerion maritima]